MRTVSCFVSLALGGSLYAGCSGERAGGEDQPAASDTVAVPSSDSVRIVNRVWQVASSTAVAPGQLYTFLADGTLLIASANGTPLVGSWSYAPGALTLVEEVTHKAEILHSSDTELRLRSINPGGTVDINLVRAKPGRIH